MDQDKIRSIISELIALSKVDGHVSSDEAALIKHMGNLLGMEDAEILELFDNPAPFDPQSSSEQRVIQFHRMVLLMSVDGEVKQEEINHIQWMGIKLGLNPGMINEILRRMGDYENNVIPPDVLISIYKKYMN